MNDFSNYTNGYERKNMIDDDDFATYFDFVIDFGIGIDFWNYFAILIEIANGWKYFSGFYVVGFNRIGPRDDPWIPDQKSSYLYEEREDDLEYVLDLVDLEDDLDEREDLDEEYLLRLGDRE